MADQQNDMAVNHEILRLRSNGLIAAYFCSELSAEEWAVAKKAIEARSQNLGEPILIVHGKTEQLYIPAASKFMQEFFPEHAGLEGLWGPVVNKDKKLEDINLFKNQKAPQFLLQVGTNAVEKEILRRIVKLRMKGVDIYLAHEGIGRKIVQGRVGPKVKLYDALDDAPRFEID